MNGRFSQDEIVEERTWRSGVEVVSRVNWSHLARVRRSLGLMTGPLGATQVRQPVSGAVQASRRRQILPQWHPRAA
jgi:hypothetical protein